MARAEMRGQVLPFGKRENGGNFRHPVPMDYRGAVMCRAAVPENAEQHFPRELPLPGDAAVHHRLDALFEREDDQRPKPVPSQFIDACDNDFYRRIGPVFANAPEKGFKIAGL